MELHAVRAAGCEVLEIGRYLRPSHGHLPVARYHTPDAFRELRETAISMGFRHCDAGPLVRSSHHAHEQVAGIRP